MSWTISMDDKMGGNGNPADIYLCKFDQVLH